MTENSKTIVFIAKYPTGELVKDGASIRFLAIDNIYKDWNKIYVESFTFPFFNFIYFLFRDFVRKYYKYPLFSNHNTKSYKYLDRKTTESLFESADIIYIENFTNLVKLDKKLLKKYASKMILDFHGCVIEEMKDLKAPWWKIANMKQYEYFALKHLKYFVSVSENMTKYYIKKYPFAKDKVFINLPIFNNSGVQSNCSPKDKFRIIYSGKNQSWQNIELMVKTIKKLLNSDIKNKLDFEIYTPDIQEISNLLKQNNIFESVNIESCTQEQLINKYKYADFGFILRDDNFVNRVACPTKLIEYMKNGIIPIVLQPEIGDFNTLGYNYILNDDILHEKIPSFEELNRMKNVNYKIINEMNSLVKESENKLINWEK